MDVSYSTSPRELTNQQREQLEADRQLVSDFKKNKLEIEAKKNWDLFYKRNGTNFYKDRHWTSREVTDMCPDIDFEKAHIFLEAGCGVGNFLFPFLDEFTNWSSYACDFSPRAVEYVKSHQKFNPSRCTAFECDPTLNDDSKRCLTSNVPNNAIDLVFLVFVLSAISPEKMNIVVENLAKVIKQDGSVIIRDYGLYDHAQLRFSKGHKLAENFYVRQDGTRAYYFSTEMLSNLFTSNSLFKTIDCRYVSRRTVNVKEGIDVPRVFVQARFRRL